MADGSMKKGIFAYATHTPVLALQGVERGKKEGESGRASEGECVCVCV